MSTPLFHAEPSAGIRFTVYGRPIPQGSIRSFRHKTTGAIVSTSDNKNLKPWRQQISGAAMEATKSYPQPVFGEHVPVEVTLRFYYSRPKSARKRPGMTTKPDLDKTLRACLDALTGIAFADDAQVIEFHCRKVYLSQGPERCEFEIQKGIV